MNPQNKQQTDFIKMVAKHLGKNFMSSLFELTKEKGQVEYIGGLAEILDWSKEFCDRYYDKVTNWEEFMWSRDNICNALNDLIISFGREKLKTFYSQPENHTNYFSRRYSSI
jgi:hypothetical protein